MVVIEPFIALPVGIFLPYIAQLHASVLLGLGAGRTVEIGVEPLFELLIRLAFRFCRQGVEPTYTGVE